MLAESFSREAARRKTCIRKNILAAKIRASIALSYLPIRISGWNSIVPALIQHSGSEFQAPNLRRI
jgi:hypothetical protein